MLETDFCQWRLFYPLISNDDENVRTASNPFVVPYTLTTKLNLLSVSAEKHARHSSSTAVYVPLGTADLVLRVQTIDKLANGKVELEMRNRQKEAASPLIEHWSIYELKHPRLELPDKVRSRVDPLTIDRIDRYLRLMHDEQNLFDRDDVACVRIESVATIWQMDDSDRQIEQADLTVIMNERASSHGCSYVPQHWRTIAVQSPDTNQLVKILTTLQIDDDKDLFDYFSLLIAQARLHSFSPSQSSTTLTTLAPEKAFVNLLTMSYAAFIELIQSIHVDQPLVQSAD